jgi:hypothetical protein
MMCEKNIVDWAPWLMLLWRQRSKKIMFKSQPGQKVSETLFQKKSWLWWFTFVIPSVKEA